MKKTFLLIFLCSVFSTVSIQAQNNIGYSSRRLNDAADRLATQTGDLSSQTYNDFRNRYNNSRSDLELLFLTQQLEASARLFQQLARDNRRGSELRDAAAVLTDLSRRAPVFGGSNYYLWRDVQATVNVIQREVGGNGGGGGWGSNNGGWEKPKPPRPVSGRVSWRGTVNIEVRLFIKGSNLETRVVSGPGYNDESFNFTSSLPSRAVTVEVNKKKGRGSVNVIQQPTRDNDFTTVIQIVDKDGGAREYDLDIYWY